MATRPYKSTGDFAFAVVSQVLLIPAAEMWAWGLNEAELLAVFDILLAFEAAAFIIFAGVSSLPSCAERTKEGEESQPGQGDRRPSDSEESSSGNDLREQKEPTPDFNAIVCA